MPKTRAELIKAGICTEDELDKVDGEAAEEVRDAIEFALQSKVTPVEETLIDVYADGDVAPRRGHYPMREAEAPNTGPTKTMAMFEAVCQAQSQAMEQDDEVFLLGEDIGDPVGGPFKTSAGLQTPFW